MKKIIIADILLIIVNLTLYLTGNLKPVDDLIYNMINISHLTTPAFKVVTSLSNTIPLCIIFISTIFVLYKIDYKDEMKNFSVVFIISALITLVTKTIIQRPRPNINRLIPITGFSYPSGHSLMSFVFYGYLIYLIHKKYSGKDKKLIIVALSCMIPLIGFSRIYLGVHYFSDVIMGYSIGLLILLINSQLDRKNIN